MFERKGLFLIPSEAIDEDSLMELVLEAGADDVKPAGGKFEVTCNPDIFTNVADALERAGIEPDVKQVTRIPTSTVDLDAETGRKVLKTHGTTRRPRRRAKCLVELQHPRRGRWPRSKRRRDAAPL